MYIRDRIFGLLASALLALLMVSCSAEIADAPDTPADDGMVDVTFRVSPQAEIRSSRGLDSDFIASMQQCSKAKFIDRLIYAVYESDGDNTYTLLSQYGNNEYGQYEVKDLGYTFINGQSYSITLRLMRGKTYHIAFWAQSSQTDAYDTRDLQHVEVRYPDMKDAAGNPVTPEHADDMPLVKSVYSNDEYRDAFCKVETFSVIQTDNTREVVLTRPFAQVNVGTTRADEKYLGSSAVNPSVQLRYSKISMSSLARFIDVVRDEIDTENLVSASFRAYPIPYYLYFENPVSRRTFFFDDPESLYVDLNYDGRFDTNEGVNYPTVDVNGVPLVEKFLYLSMSYVLVPDPKLTYTPDDDPEKDNQNWDVENRYLTDVEFTFGESESLDNSATGSIGHVLAQRNWRTNILGGLGNGSDPSKSSIAGIIQVSPGIDPGFGGDWNIFP